MAYKDDATKKPTRKDYQIFPDGTWAQPKRHAAKAGDLDGSLLYYHVGEALAVWETVEEAMATLFQFLCECDEPRLGTLLAKTYGSIESHGARVKALTTVMEIYLQPYLKYKEVGWLIESLCAEVSVASHRRNEIAHGISSMFIPLPSKEAPDLKPPYGAYLLAPKYMTGRNDNTITDLDWITTSKYCYTSTEIKEMAEKFARLRNEILGYVSKLIRNPSGVPSIISTIIQAAETRAEPQGRQQPFLRKPRPES